MELKPYQQDVLDDLELYLEYVQEDHDYAKAFNRFWEDKIGAYNPVTGDGMRPYKNNVPGAVHACVKVPTAGGKTFIAVNALRTIFNAFDVNKPKAVVWLVPWRNLLDQAYEALSDPDHPYRQKLNSLFNHRVGVYKKEDLLQGANFNPTVVEEQLSIFVMSFASLRARRKEDRKVFEENGQLASFADSFETTDHVLEDTDETALINVIRKLNPVVVLDESHNAETDLSVEMLKDLRPSFILDLTATPKSNSNIISTASAMALKREHMVKLPVIVYNHHDKTEVVNSALHLQSKLERLAKKEHEDGGKYIRPIVLFQAQADRDDDSTTFTKIKEQLLELQIPEEQIAIKTANINDLDGIDLMSKDCPIRYIITINALKEGWDCPFAYILASLANRSSAVDVEQILGRVLRQPGVIKHNSPLLNLSYVLTASNQFAETLDNIVDALQESGFSKRDYRQKDRKEESQEKSSDPLEQLVLGESEQKPVAEEDEPIETNRIRFSSENAEDTEIEDEIVSDIEETAVKESEEFERKIQDTGDSEAEKYNDLKHAKVTMYRMKDHFKEEALSLELPQFFIEIKGAGNELFGTESELVPLDQNYLLGDFRLSNQNAEINFSELESELYKVDLEETGNNQSTPSFARIENDRVREPLVEYIRSQPKENQVKSVAHTLIELIGSIYPIPEEDIKVYVQRILSDMNSEQLIHCIQNKYTYKDIIKRKIRALADEHAEKEFQKKVDTKKIKAHPNFKLKEQLTPGNLAPSISRSLYEREASINKFEEEILLKIHNLDNVKFWHRNLERGKGFAINGFKSNHYPDFLIYTEKGNVVIIETKGDDRDNSDSIAKNKLGKKWAELSGENYHYFMVFNHNAIEGAYNANQIRDVVSEL
ncbi:DEAD/DEAH box helicase [Gracilimonas tropica]|uniref:DEAD/DEAH box helicase n=1 Tax=Gracilimonas tropica TaxID=454600 RepID=UPI000361A7E1|nr:DEAD/DEAH box helicase family protein [Gracilimonas tropica]